MPDSQLDKLDSRLANIAAKLDEAQAERRSSKLLMNVWSAIITTAVGLGGWWVQNHVQANIAAKANELNNILEVNREELKSTLALTQEVYTRKLDRYEAVHQQMVALEVALDKVEADLTQKKAADDAISNLYSACNTDSLYLSTEVSRLLTDLVNWSGGLPSMVSPGAPTPEQSGTALQDLDAKIKVIEGQMQKDLNLPQLGQIPSPRNGAQP